MRPLIDVLAYKVETFDNDVIREDLLASSRRLLYLVFNKDGIYADYAPAGVNLRSLRISFTKLNNPRLGYLFYPVFFFIDHLRIFIYFLKIICRFEVKTVVVENTYVAFLVGLLRRMRFFKKMLYFPGDWLAGQKGKQGLWSYLGNNVVFPFFDYWACRFSDMTVNHTRTMMQERRDFWGKGVSRKEVVFQPRLIIKVDIQPVQMNRKIIFLGKVRPDSGLDIALQALKAIREKLDVTMKIIYANSSAQDYLKKIIEAQRLGNVVEMVSFVDRHQFAKELSEGFCGINLLTFQDSYSSKTLPAKIFDYLQYLLPIIATSNIGSLSNVIKVRQLGIIIEPDTQSFTMAVEEVFRRQSWYRKNISTYIDAVAKKSMSLKSLLDDSLEKSLLEASFQEEIYM